LSVDLSICATLAWQRAAEVAGRCNHQFIDKEHILIGICELEEVCAKVALNNDTLNLILGSTLVSEVEVIDQGMKNCNLNKSKLSKALRERMGKGNFIHTERVIHRSNECIECFVKAQEIAELRKESEIRCVHLLMAILEQPGEVIESVLTDFQTTPEKLRLAFERLLDTPYLTLYGVDITAKAEDGKIDPVIGREEEIDYLVRILCQREKNNPVLIGDAGVGKTAIVEGLALLLARKENNIIKALGEKRIIQLDINAVVAGTIYRGQFEERLKKCLEEAKAN
ncbi:MAG: Clp protease N-terminal domain-containing protein, partial [Candidatus Bathyarchaeia archaeon]